MNGARAVWLVLAATCGCRPAPSSAEPSRTPVLDTARPSAPRERFLDVDVEPADVHLLRARIIRGAAVYSERLGRPEGEGSGRTMALDVVVLDDDVHGDPSRPRVLCESASHRIAVHVDGGDLATVARAQAVMTATPQNGTGWSGRQPGVLVRAGTTLRQDGSTGGAHVHAQIERPWLRLGGFLPSTYVGRTWTPAPTEARMHEPADARVREPTALLASPGGMELGRIDPRMRAGGVFVRRVGVEQNGFVLVRHDEPESTAVGWIAAAMLEDAFAAPAGARIPGGRESAVEPTEPGVELPRGTLLRAGELRNPIGVVTERARFHCVDDCAGDAPRVEVDACTTTVRVWADRRAAAPASARFE